MRRTRRKLRRVGKWAGLAIVLLVLGVDVASGWRCVFFISPLGYSIGVGNGAVAMQWATDLMRGYVCVHWTSASFFSDGRSARIW